MHLSRSLRCVLKLSHSAATVYTGEASTRVGRCAAERVNYNGLTPLKIASDFTSLSFGIDQDGRSDYGLEATVQEVIRHHQ